MNRLLALALFFAAALASAADKAERPLHRVDDLNHWVGHLGRNNRRRHRTSIVSLRWASRSRALIAPRRYAIRRVRRSSAGNAPGVTGIYDNQNPFARVLKADVSLVTQFKERRL
jgi:hypothetical protein